MPIAIASVILAAAAVTAVICGNRAENTGHARYRHIGAAALIVAAIDGAWLITLTGRM